MKTEEEVQLRNFQKVLDILEKYKYNKSRLITILQKVQDEYRYLPQEVLVFIATALKMPVAEVYGVVTFYTHFTLKAKGKYQIKVCDGTACHVKGSMPLVDALYNKLKINEKNNTTADMMFTVETVSCLGACGLAPVMVVNERVYGQVSKDKVSAIIDSIVEEEGGKK